MAVEKTINQTITTRAYEIVFKSKTEPMAISYTSDVLGFRGVAEIDAELILQAITQEELIALQQILQKLADHFNPDRAEDEAL